MKFGIPWGAKEIRPQVRDTDGDTGETATPSREPFLDSAAHVSVAPEFQNEPLAKQTRSDPRRLGGMIGRFDIETAIAEISARRSMLEAEPPVMPFAAAPAPHLSSLEAQLRKITEQIETLRRPGVEEAISALRSEFRDVSRLLTEKASRNAENFPDQPQGGLSRLEQDVAQLREAVRSPAADVADLKEAIAALSGKIDLAVVQSDPVSLQRVESSIASLRNSCARLATNDTVAKLADCVHALAQKLEGISHGGAVTAGAGTAADHLEGHIVRLTERLDASNSRLDHLEAIERGLADLLVQIDTMRADKGDRPRADHAVEAKRSAQKLAAVNVAARIAVSEAALDSVKTGTGAESNERSNFILAARRAAQAAAQEPSPRAAMANTREKPGSAKGSKLTNRMKSVLVAACVIAIVIGSLQIASKFLGFGKATTSPPHATQNVPEPANDDSTGSIAADMIENADDARTLLSKGAPSSGNIAAAPAANLTNPQSIVQAPPSATGTEKPPQTAKANDVTGSIPSALIGGHPIVPPIPMPPDAAAQSAARIGTLPAAIGSASLRKAAAEGNPAAAYELGTRFAEGRGVAPDLEQAAHWFERAAVAGLAPAQFRLASLYEKGRGVEKDLARARALYLAAAEKGNAKAMHNLAVLYAEGADGTPDYTTAARWFLKAANHGIADSQYNLAILYARGLGVKKSYGDSYKWFALAAEKGDHEAAKKRDEIAKRLDPNALAAARQAVKTWTAQPQPAEATIVPPPAGGWDHSKPAASAADAKARKPS